MKLKEVISLKTQKDIHLVEGVHLLQKKSKYCISLKCKKNIEVSKKAPFTPNKFSKVKQWNAINICKRILSILIRKINSNLIFDDFESN